MNDLNHMDVVPRIIDNSMKITKEQLKNEKKRNEQYNKPQQVATPVTNTNTNTTKHTNNNSTEKSKPEFNFNHILIILIVVLVIIVAYMVFLIYKDKKDKKDKVLNIPKFETQIPTNVEYNNPENYEQYIQTDDDLETMSIKSTNSSKQEPKFVQIKENVINEEDEKSEVGESIISNIEIQQLGDDDEDELIDNEDEDENKLDISIIDKIQEDLQK